MFALITFFIGTLLGIIGSVVVFAIILVGDDGSGDEMEWDSAVKRCEDEQEGDKGK